MVPKFLFDFLTASRKHKLLLDKGLMIGTKNDNGRRVHLYMVEDFYAEVTYKYSCEEEIKWIKTFSSLDDQKFETYKDINFAPAN